MKISIAQIKPLKGDILANIDKHIMLVKQVSKFKASAIFFPELSLTGYEPELANALAMTQDDSRLEVFQNISDSYNITIGLGVPIKSDKGIKISMIIFQADKQKQIYSKQQLHSDELPYFVEGEEQIILTVDNKKIAPAICYESLQDNHSAEANKLGAEIYLASVAKSHNGLNKAIEHFPMIAKKYSMPVLMSNCVGFCDNFVSVGQSSIWTKQGILIGQLDAYNEGILIFDTKSERLTKQGME